MSFSYNIHCIGHFSIISLPLMIGDLSVISLICSFSYSQNSLNISIGHFPIFPLIWIFAYFLFVLVIDL